MKEGDDVIVVDMCRDRIPRARFASKKEPAPGATVKRDPSGKIFTVSIVRVNRNLFVYPYTVVSHI